MNPRVARMKENEKPVAFVVLIPSDPYFVAIQAQLISRLSANYPNHIILLIPVFGIQFSRPFTISHVDCLKAILNLYRYYKTQLFLGLEVKSLLRATGLYKLGNNTRLYHWHDYAINAFWPIINHNQKHSFRSLLEEYSIEGVKCGDLIIDSYLRYKPSPQFISSDSFVDKLISSAHSYQRFFSHICTKYNVRCFFGSYTTYIHHGIPLRLAQHLGIQSFTFGSTDIFFRHHRPGEFLSHAANHTKYKSDADFPSPSTITKIQDSLTNRLLGKPDITMPYMRQFSTAHLADIQVKGKYVIFLHDFFDSPHIYRWMLHRDFFHWITDTVEVLTSNGFELFIKPHPNQTIESKLVVSRLMEDYSCCKLVNWLSDQTSNSSILHDDPMLVISVYGSVLVEAAYCGVRSMSAGDHPAHNFNIAYNPSDLSDYHSKLLKPSLIPLPESREAIAFLAQHCKAYNIETIQSLKSFLGITFERLYADPLILSSTPVLSFIQSSVDRILERYPF